jgi:quinol monooxygenase YgiN
MNGDISVVAHVRAKKGKEEETKQALLALVAPTRVEEGCINYDLHQFVDDPTLFVFYENWTSRELLERHLASPHVTAFRARMDELLSEPPDIKVFRMVSDLDT